MGFKNINSNLIWVNGPMDTSGTSITTAFPTFDDYYLAVDPAYQAGVIYMASLYEYYFSAWGLDSSTTSCGYICEFGKNKVGLVQVFNNKRISCCRLPHPVQQQLLRS